MCVFLYLSIRNLSLGAKAEYAIGKHSIDLEKKTRQELKNLLSGDNKDDQKVWVEVYKF